MQSRKQKLDNLKSIGNQTLREITETKETFKKYLDFNARLYKYKFEEAVLIYAQNPNATACATLNIWNKIGRRIHKGTKATPVFADEKQSQIKYLFELSNTYGRTFKTPIITKIPEYKKQKILDFFGVEPISEDFNKNFKWSVEKYVEENYLDFINDFINANSKFAPTRRDKLTTDEFKRTVTDCVGYVLCERFSIPKGIYNSDEHSFTELDKFNTKELIVLLGCSTQYIARSTIEAVNTILNEKERENNNEIYSRENGAFRSNANSRGSNGVRENGGTEADETGEMGVIVPNIYGGKPSSPQIFPSDGGGMATDDNGRTGGSQGHGGTSDRAISKNQPTPETGVLEDTTIRTGDEELYRRSNTERTNTQIQIDTQEPLTNNQGSFNFKEEESWKEETEEPHTTEEESTAKTTQDTTKNFMITSENDIGLSSGKTKYQENLKAIKLLKELESQKRFANTDEQKVLAKYSGFGGIPQAFDEHNNGWTNEYKELREILTDKEYELAKGSTLNAHYTSTEVVSSIYNGLKRVGFNGGNILEPSMGVGNFFGMLPENLSSSRLYGVELDDITGRIAKQLYPNANIEIKGFENTNFQDNFFDAVIGNIPFGNYKVFDTKFNKQNLLIHDYFIAKSLDKVKPNGVIAFITSKGTMDKANSSFRKYLAERAELLGAIRLPNNAFKQSAQTEVTTDILFLKKRDKLIDATEENWIYTGFYNTGKLNENGEHETLPLNQYFIDNPQMMLGEMRFDKSMYGNDKETALFPFTGDVVLNNPEDKFKTNFEALRNNNNYTHEQLQWIKEFEKTATESGKFNAESFLGDPYFKKFGYGAWLHLSKMFDEKLGVLVRAVNAEPVAKSEISLKELLEVAINKLPENVIKDIATLDDLEDAEKNTIPADPTLKNYCFKFIDNKLYQRENSIMIEQDLPKTTIDRVKSLIELRDVTKNILDIQLDNCSDEELATEQTKLDSLYNKFVKKYGIINSSYNKRIFGEDAEFPLLSSIEEIKDNDTIVKADVFTKRTILPIKKITFVETSIEALAVSLNERGYIDIGFMSSLSKKTNEQVIEELQGIIFKNPLKDSLSGRFDYYNNWETADEYLSGDVAEKLQIAKEHATENEIYKINVSALESVQPIPLEAHEINVKLGSSWIDTEYYKQFIFETFNPKEYEKNGIDVKYYNKSNNWYIDKPYSRYASLESTQVFGTKRMDSYKLMELMLNQKSPKIYDTIEIDGSEKRVLNKAETIAIKDKSNQLNETFKRWIFSDPDRREKLVKKYNSIFNNERVRQYDGSFLRFDGMNPFINLREHQKNAVARILLGGNTLLAHVVGSGKTYTMVASAMEMKRLGLSNKPCFVVPNHLVGQWSNEFKRLYPNANILSATKRDFEKKKRQRFCARIATGEWDAIIIGHSSFEKIPISSERQEQKLKQDIKIAKEGLKEAQKDKSERFLVKEIERTVKNLEVKLKKLRESTKDNVIDFENLGIDSLFIDEAHAFKNKFMFTKMGNIAGLSKAHSKKSYDIELKCDYINEVNKSERGVVFASGTPLSNSMVELFTMQSYLQKNSLEKRGLEFFDNWASNFGERITALELDTSGQGFKMKERFAKFTNLPELMNLYRMIADIQTSEMLSLPVPKIKDGKPITISVEPSLAQQALVKALLELSTEISKGSIKPEVYNMLCVTNDGRLGALDMRCVNTEKFEQLLGYKIEDLTKDDYEFSKVNACVDKVYSIYKDTEKDKLTQMIFSDIATPKAQVEFTKNADGVFEIKPTNDYQFSIYDDIKLKLMNKGIPEKEIAFIHTAKTDEEKEKIFSKMRSGEIRILLGSTQKMGAGTNAQRKLIALHHLDCPFRPSDLSQREGRIIRQGNENPEVQIYQFVTKKSFDSYLWQMVETKQKFISQIMSGKNPTRTMEDVDATVLNYAEVKAIATGNPAIKRKMELEIEQNRLKVLEQQYYQVKYNLEDNIIKRYPKEITDATNLIRNLELDIKMRNSNASEDFSIKIGKTDYTDKKDAGDILLKAIASKKYINQEIGEYKGFKIIPLENTMLTESPKIMLKGASNYTVELSASELGSIQRLENAVLGLEDRLENAKNRLETANQQLEASKVQMSKPFEHQLELNEVLKELSEVNNSLDIGKEDNSLIVDEESFNTIEEIEVDLEEDMEL